MFLKNIEQVIHVELPKRKKNRLTEYDYSTPSAYFITVCTGNRKNLFWKDVGAIIDRPKNVPLTNLGVIAQGSIEEISKHYPAISVDHYVIMPNHIHLLLQCYPHTSALYTGNGTLLRPKCGSWHVLARLSADLYVLCRRLDSNVRYAPVYIHSFRLYTPQKLQQGKYETVGCVPDRLRWLRHSKGLTQDAVAEQVGMSPGAYRALEAGDTQSIPLGTLKRLADCHGVPMEDLLDEFHQFLYDGQAYRIRAYRVSLGLGKKSFARACGIPIRSLQAWESGRKVISRKSWERHFKGRA